MSGSDVSARCPISKLGHLKSPLTLSYGVEPIRVLELDGMQWWVAVDICAVLQIVNTSQAVKRLDADDVCAALLEDSLGRNQEVSLVNEAGLYSLILRSDKPQAKEFKRWITKEVLPAIRKTGRYELPTDLAPQQLDGDPGAQLLSLGIDAARRAVQGLADVAEIRAISALLQECRNLAELVYARCARTSASESLPGGSEVERLLIAAADASEADRSFTIPELFQLAKEQGIEIAPEPKSLGRRLQQWRGVPMADSKGRTFRVAHRKRKIGAVYNLHFSPQ